VEHVGIGSDFDGIEITPEGMENVGCLPKVFEEMRRRGYSEEQISLISGENLLAVMDRIISCSK
jgi:membrane dipeptidase